jgi:hypothetical protein
VLRAAELAGSRRLQNVGSAIHTEDFMLGFDGHIQQF